MVGAVDDLGGERSRRAPRFRTSRSRQPRRRAEAPRRGASAPTRRSSATVAAACGAEARARRARTRSHVTAGSRTSSSPRRARRARLPGPVPRAARARHARRCRPAPGGRRRPSGRRGRQRRIRRGPCRRGGRDRRRVRRRGRRPVRRAARRESDDGRLGPQQLHLDRPGERNGAQASPVGRESGTDRQDRRRAAGVGEEPFEQRELAGRGCDRRELDAVGPEGPRGRARGRAARCPRGPAATIPATIPAAARTRSHSGSFASRPTTMKGSRCQRSASRGSAAGAPSVARSARAAGVEELSW